MHDTRFPRLHKEGQVTQLLVDGKPFLILGGELGNSSASDPTELEMMFVRLRQMHLNTLLLPVYWDRIEAEEGRFDFSLVRAAIESARVQGMRLVLLWFGLWKNSMSCYAPSWVKRDTARFPRVRLRTGAAVEIVSPASVAARSADARAFAALLHWLALFDGNEHTVIMVQVENEIGMIPEPRDYSPESEAIYRAPVPQRLLSRLIAGELGPEVTRRWQQAGERTARNWADVFGTEPEGEEVFSAWQFATYIEEVTAAGKKEYPLPMFTNAALIRPGYRPGQYPSAGPLPHLMEIWQTGAPSLDMLSPDIYFPNFQEWSERYVRGTNPLFIPEMAASARVAGNCVYAIGQLGAMGTAPFAIETTDKRPMIRSCYRALEGMSTRILDGQRDGRCIALSPRIAFDWAVSEEPVRGTLAGIVFEATFERSGTGVGDETTTLPTLGVGRWEAPVGTPCGAVLIVEVGDEEFLLLGFDTVVTFAPAEGHGNIGIDQVQAGWFDSDGTWHGGRWLNGDQTHQGRHVRFGSDGWSVQWVRLYRYA